MAPRHKGIRLASAACGSLWDGRELQGLPEGVEGAHVQHGEQFCFGFGEGQAVVQGLKCRHNKSCLPVRQLQLLDGVPTEVERV